MDKYQSNDFIYKKGKEFNRQVTTTIKCIPPPQKKRDVLYTRHCVLHLFLKSFLIQ